MDWKRRNSDYVYCIHCSKMRDVNALYKLIDKHRISVYAGNCRLRLRDAMDLFILNYDHDITICSEENIEAELDKLGILVS